MPHFYFDLLEDGEVIADPEGAELENLAAARVRAIAAIRDLLSEAVERGRLPLNHVMAILDKEHCLLAKVHFGEAIDIVH